MLSKHRSEVSPRAKSSCASLFRASTNCSSSTRSSGCFANNVDAASGRRTSFYICKSFCTRLLFCCCRRQPCSCLLDCQNPQLFMMSPSSAMFLPAAKILNRGLLQRAKCRREKCGTNCHKNQEEFPGSSVRLVIQTWHR